MREPVVSTWHETDATVELEQTLTLEAQARIARRCLAEIDRASALASPFLRSCSTALPA